MAEPLFSSRKLKFSATTDVSRPNCSACGLHRKCKSPKMGVTGKGGKGILFLAEAPSKQEDAENQQLIGEAGQYLRGALRKMGLLLDLDCWKINAVNCRPTDSQGKNRSPTGQEIECCRPMVTQLIQKLRPEKIVILGTIALESLLGHRWPGQLGGIGSRWRSWQIPDRELKAWLYPTFHPSFILRSEKDALLANAFHRDLKAMAGHEPEAIDWDEDPEKLIDILTDPMEVKRAIRKLRDSGLLVSFDYETTGLKPYAEGHGIITASMATEDAAISFPFYPEIHGAWKRFLRSDAPKTAHNMKFEELWGDVILGTRTSNWRLCTMQMAHVLDNRRGVTGLEFLGYVMEGYLPWEADMARYKKAPGRDANGFNRMREAPMRSLLLYGGMDAFVQNRIAQRMMRIL